MGCSGQRILQILVDHSLGALQAEYFSPDVLNNFNCLIGKKIRLRKIILRVELFSSSDLKCFTPLQWISKKPNKYGFVTSSVQINAPIWVCQSLEAKDYRTWNGSFHGYINGSSTQRWWSQKPLMNITSFYVLFVLGKAWTQTLHRKSDSGYKSNRTTENDVFTAVVRCDTREAGLFKPYTG